MVYIQFNNKGIPHKIELIPGSQMKIAAELHDMFCQKSNHELCHIKPWMKPAERVVKVVLG
jgi:hypothetical protein